MYRNKYTILDGKWEKVSWEALDNPKHSGLSAPN